MCRPVDRELNNQQIEEFFDIGFTTAEQFFDDREMSEISSDFDRLLEIAEEIVRAPDFNPDDAHNIEYDGSYFDLRCMDGETKRFEIRKIAWGGGAVPVLLHYGRHPRLLHLASQLLGSDEMNHLINNAHRLRGRNKDAWYHGRFRLASGQRQRQ